MSDQSFFSPQSPFAAEGLAAKARSSRLLPIKEAEKLFDLEQTKTSAVKEAKAPIEHWHHDIETILILLEERHPDVRRSSDLLREIQREMDRWTH